MKKTFLLALAALALAISCQKNSDTNDTIEVTPKPVMRTVTCTIANTDADSKVALNTTTGKTEWEVDDEILFHGKYTGEHNDKKYSVVVKLTAENISADKKSFTATIPAFENAATQSKWEDYGCKSNIIAAYPASAVAVNYGDNWYYNNKFNATNLPLMSGFNDDYDSDHFTFYNLTGILSFIVTGDIDSYTLAGNNSEAVSYTGYTSRIYKKTDGSINTAWVSAGTPVATVSGTVTPGNETRIYIPGGVSFTGGFTITFSNGGTPVKTLSTTKSVDVPRNSYRPMGDVTSYLKDYVAPATHNSSITVPANDSDYNLSKTASANCYIVDGSVAANANKEFKFKAYKGNSTTNVGTIASVEVLWETYNNADDVTANSVIAAVDYDKQAANDYYEIVFKMPTTLHAGNAVIAAKNAGGTILWSWHIWVPETTVSTNSYGDALGAVAMDRNLGALVAATAGSEAIPVKSLGFLYQWGRKDPFLGASSLTNGASAVSVNGTATSVSSGTISLEYSIANPTVFAYVADKDWINVSDDALWQNASKTIYDPCPPGYRVPVRNGDKAFWSSDLSSKTGWAENGTYGWFTLGNPAGVFPFAGYRDDSSPSSIAYAGTRALYWTSHRSGSVTSYGADVRFGSRHQLSSPARSRGGSIRCVVE